jgi:hypothetical protein
MWLPKHERRLLQGYYINIGQCDKEKWFHISNWGPVVNSRVPVVNWRFIRCKARCVKAYGEGAQTNEPDNETLKKKIIQILKDEKTITAANKILEARGFIKLREHQSAVNVVGITLTLDGYNLGNKYDSLWQWSNLWFVENIKNHWISLIIGFLAGSSIGHRLVNWLSKILM